MTNQQYITDDTFRNGAIDHPTKGIITTSPGGFGRNERGCGQDDSPYGDRIRQSLHSDNRKDRHSPRSGTNTAR